MADNITEVMVMPLHKYDDKGGKLTLFIEKIRINLITEFRIRLEEKAIIHLLKVKSSYFAKVSQSELLNRIDVDINNMCNIFNTNTFSAVSSILSLIGGMVSIFMMDIGLAFLFFITLPFKYLIIHYHSRYQKKRMNDFLDKNMRYAKWFSEFISGIITIRLFGIEKNKHNEFLHLVNEKVTSQKNLEMISQYRRMADSMLNGIWNIMIYLVGGVMIAKGEMSIGNLYAFISYSAFVTVPLFSILNIKVIFTGIIPSAVRFFEFIDLQEESLNEQNRTEFQTSDILFQNTKNQNKIIWYIILIL